MANRKIGESSIRKRRDGRWMTQLTIKLPDGDTKRISITDPDRDVVKAKLQEIQDCQLKMIPFSPKNWLVGDYLDHWLNNILPSKIRATTIVHYEGTVRLYIKPTIGMKKLSELGVRDVTHALDELERKGISGRNRQKYKQVLSSCLSHAMREELVFRNVAQIAKMPAVHAKPTIPWTASQAKYFLEQLQDDKYYVAYLILLTYGLRIGEMLGLRWSDIDFKNDIIIIRQQVLALKGKLIVQTVKTDASRREIPLVPAVRQALLDHAAKNAVKPPQFAPQRESTTEGLVITTCFGTPLEPNNFRKRNFYIHVKRLGLPQTKLHALRHAAATFLKDMGVPIKDVQEILGHSDISTTLRIYQHGNKIIKRNALTRMSEGLASSYTQPLVIAQTYSQCSQMLQSGNEKMVKSAHFSAL